jgi:MarR family transcriptional regulator, organic hydroperoxide resistance regulator
VSRYEPRAALAAEAWRAIMDFIGATARQRTQALAELGLTVNDSRALSALDAKHGRSMRSLADEWSCDASTATFIIDRLERKGLAERRSDPDDRRVRLVLLTARGIHTRDEMLRRMYAPPPELAELDHQALTALRDGVAQLPAAENRSASPRAPRRRQ